MPNPKMAVIGLGYVGLPLAIKLARAQYDVTGVDINTDLLRKLAEGELVNRDIPRDLYPLPTMKLSAEVPDDCSVYFVCVPTPHVDRFNRMDATAVIATCQDIGEIMPDGSVVVIESTVTPGTTGGLLRDTIANCKGDDRFYMAFSPERINPGPTFHQYEEQNNIKLIGADPHVQSIVSQIYNSIYPHIECVGIEEAELVKVFENAQRDINIALMNELSENCYNKNLNFPAVLRGLRTKRTSPVFTSGLVGGHCIAVDPYFLSDYYGVRMNFPSMGRQRNENFIEFVARIAIENANGPVVIMGRSYKPGVVDKRNSGSIKLYEILEKTRVEVYLHDWLTDMPYDGPSPEVLVGAVNHFPQDNIFHQYKCDYSTTLITLGDNITSWQKSMFAQTIDL